MTVVPSPGRLTMYLLGDRPVDNDEAEAYMDAIVKNEPTLIPLDVGSDYDKLFVFDRMWAKANWESDEKVCGIGSWQAMGSISELDDDPAGDIERLKDKMTAAGANKVYTEMQKQAQEFNKGE